MDVLKEKIRCLDMVRGLDEAVEAMEHLEIEMKNTEQNSISLQQLYEEEFRLAVEISGLFEDIHIILEKIEKHNPEYKFFCSRIRKEIDGMVKLETIMEGE